ncbi:hypothetical protein [Celeribacter naphthalenivorans]|uniref:hypothetical protein n=1 Tax=Celeribacter naphthalenivorans TaxID=1614694 RepID=UPI001CFA5859|nr:hypothetical protein [Celeribacter naphthalenivorans]
MSCTPEQKERVEEALYVCLRGLQAALAFRSITETKHIGGHPFFNLASGALSKDFVTEWTKLLGSRSEDSHWTKILPEDCHGDLRAGFDADCDQRNWTDVHAEMIAYRNKYVVHLGDPDGPRPAKHPNFDAPINILKRLYCELVDFYMKDCEGVKTGLVDPSSLSDEFWANDQTKWCALLEKLRAASKT